MKSKPILFSTEMVQAILEGRKTQTRRVIKNEVLQSMKNLRYDGIEEDTDSENYKHHYVELVDEEGNPMEYYSSIGKCNYGEIGDIIWVRESFAKVEFENKPTVYLYKANPEHQSMRWKPSIHMPKEACRLFLKVTNVRVERLWDISEQDSKAEGCSFEIIHNIKEYKDYLNPNNTFPVYAKLSFISLWEKINGVKSLEENPFVWVIEFERVDKPENF
jgi:hypothetical protein